MKAVEDKEADEDEKQENVQNMDKKTENITTIPQLKRENIK